MNIKDPEVHRLAHTLAKRRRVSATRAVRQALEEALAQDSARRAGMTGRLLELSERSRAVPDPVLTAEDLYDEHGLPR